MLFEEGKGFCPWCERGTAFKQVDEIHYASPKHGGRYTYSLEFEGPTRTGVLIYKCLHCDKAVVLLEHEVDEELDGQPGKLRTRTMVVPEQPPRSLDISAPAGVRSLYAEASKCESAGGLRGAGVLYRAAVEELVKDQNASGKDLFHKIDSLKGTLPPHLIQDLHEARMLGNDSIHAGITYSAEEVADVADLIEEAVLVLYVQPQQKQAMRDARKARRAAAKP